MSIPLIELNFIQSSPINSIAEHSGTSYPSVVCTSGSGSKMKSIECVEKADINLGNLTLLDSVYHFLQLIFQVPRLFIILKALVAILFKNFYF